MARASVFFCVAFVNAVLFSSSGVLADTDQPASSIQLVSIKNDEPAKKTDKIALSDIWAYEVPGTKDVRKLEPDLPKGLPNEELIRRSSVVQMHKLLLNPPQKGKSAGSAFVVNGTGKEALKQAVQVLSHTSLDLTPHLALIALGRLSPEIKQVKLEPLPPTNMKGEPAKPMQDLHRRICEPFSFEIQR